MKTIVRGWVCTVGAVILGCSAALLSGCSGLVSSANNPPPASTLVITNVQTGSVTTSSSQVVWTTNTPANSSVSYGTTTAYGTSTPVDSAMVTSHQVTLSGLAAGTTYYYQVNSTDSKGNHGNGGNSLKTAGFSITGTINPTAAGNGATVALSGTATAATTADSSGNYIFAGLPNGPYMVTPTHTGYAFTPGNQSATVNGTNVTGVNFTATPAAQQISVNPTSLNLGAIAVGSTARGTATVSNVGGSSLTVSLISVSGGPFGVSGIITPSAILPGASATLNVTYSPSIARSNSGAITITSNDPQTPTSTISLAGTATAAPVAPTITTQPANQTVMAGQTATFTVVAGGTAPLSYQWQKNGANIAGATAASYTTPVTVTADSGSTFAVVVSNTAGTVTSTATTLTVNPAPASGIQPNPTSFNFGNDVVGTSLSQVLIIQNTGTATLTISQITATGPGFSVSGFSLPLNVNAGQQTTVTMAFQPTAVGTVSGNISIASNAPTSPTSVALSGTGIAAILTLGTNPTSLNFGNVTTGTSSATQNVTITNTGNYSVAISQINLSGAGYSMTGGSAPVTLSPSQTITLVAQFTPTTAGAVTGSITIVSNASGSPATISLSGTGVSPVQHSVALTWSASTSTVVGYNVYRSTVSGNSYTMINPSLVALLNYTDTTVQSGIAYYYVTTAVDSTGSESVYSNEVSAPIP